MKKESGKDQETHRTDVDEILPEYDFSRARRNKYASRYAPGSLVVVLEPDVADAPANRRFRGLLEPCLQPGPGWAVVAPAGRGVDAAARQREGPRTIPSDSTAEHSPPDVRSEEHT